MQRDGQVVQEIFQHLFYSFIFLTKPATTLNFLSRLVFKELVDLSRGEALADKIRKRRRSRQ